MGAQCTRVLEDTDDENHTPRAMKETPVFLHLYDLGTSCAGQALNQLLRPLGSPALHCGVEVFHNEWSFSFLTKGGEVYEGSGVFSGRPRECDGHSYCQSLHLGTTTHTQGMFAALILQLKQEWPSKEYDVFTRNCVHFANDLCLRLGVGPLPAWVMRLSDVGAALNERQCVSATSVCCDQPRPGDICCCGPSPKHMRSRGQCPTDPWKDDLVMALSVKTSNGSVEETMWYDGESYGSPRPCAPLLRPGSPSTRTSRRAEEEEPRTPRAFQGFQADFVL